MHEPQACRFKDERCHFCQGRGHISKVCMKKAAETTQRYKGTPRKSVKPPPRVHHTDTIEKGDDEFDIFKIDQMTPEPAIILPMKINGVSVPMELDIGASLTILSEDVWKEKFPDTELKPTTVKLKTYTGEELKVIGQVQVDICYEGQNCQLPLPVIKGNGPALLGRNWLKNIKLNWGTIKKVANDLDDVLSNTKRYLKMSWVQ